MLNTLSRHVLDDVFSHIAYGCTGPMLTTNTSARAEYYRLLAAKVIGIATLDASIAQQVLDFLFLVIRHSGLFSETEDIPPGEIFFRSEALFAILSDANILRHRLLSPESLGGLTENLTWLD